MENTELLLAIRAIVKDEITDFRKDVNDKFDKIDQRLDVIDQRLGVIDQRLDVIDERLDVIDEQLAEIKENTEITRVATNSLVEWAETVGVVTRVEFPIKRVK